ncbi:MAG: holo-ACP synthase [Candidatus Helarchaeota archaeon]|nr:holo-ACP synthase [Candidatus Helarchaeota archaeon]
MSALLGIGVDIESIDRFRNRPKDENKKFYERIFTSLELEYCFNKKDPYPHLAARFAAKEAVIKAFSGLKRLYFSNIEVKNNDEGKPYLKILAKGQNSKEEVINEKVLLTISHSDKYVVALVVVSEE